MPNIENVIQNLERIEGIHYYGRVMSIKGLLIEASGLDHIASIGSRCKVIARNAREIEAEVVGFRESITLLMPFTDLDGIGVGCRVVMQEEQSFVLPDESWLGRVVNGLGQAIDDKGPIFHGTTPYPFRNHPPPAHKRKRVGEKIDLGVRAINTFLSCCKGQRMGIFAGSGVGKSMLISMLTRYSEAEIKVIGLIGERSREVQEFIQEYLGEEGLKKTVLVVATSDESALMRRQASYLTLSIAEYFRDQGKEVLCMMDSVTRFAMAQREIGLSAGEPPTTKGYTPTVFTELPKLLERAGPGVGKGNITGLFTVLVEGDDHNEPISDAVRGILDGHIVLDRSIAERGRFPSINVLRSVSRTMPKCNTEEENSMVTRARRLMSTYDDMAEMIRIGAYRRGSNPEVDQAIYFNEPLERFLSQGQEEPSDLAKGYEMLSDVLRAKKREQGDTDTDQDAKADTGSEAETAS